MGTRRPARVDALLCGYSFVEVVINYPHNTFIRMELTRNERVLQLKHGNVFKVVVGAGADAAAVWDDVMEAAICVDNYVELCVTVCHIRVMCSAAVRAELPIPAFPDLPNPADGLDVPVHLTLAHHSPLPKWRIMIVPVDDDVPRLRALPLARSFHSEFVNGHCDVLVRYVPYGVQELAVTCRAFSNGTPRGPSLGLDTAALFYGDSMEPLTSCMEPCDEYGVNWIVLDKPLAGKLKLRCQFHFRGFDAVPGQLKISLFNKITAWPHGERHAWTRCCVDASR